jgi:hypothetical protein
MKRCEKSNLVNTEDAISFFFKVTKTLSQIGFHENLQSFLVSPNNGFAILAYLGMNFL